MYSLDSNLFFDMFPTVGKTYTGNMSQAIDVKVLLTLCNAFRPKRVLEIGINLGHTASQILKYSPFIENYIGIDIPYKDRETAPVGQVQEVPEKPAMVVDDPRLRVILRPGGLRNVDETELGMFDFIFIDGDHTYEGIKFDTEYCEKILNSNGIMTWHDFMGSCMIIPVAEYLENYSKDYGRLWWVRGSMVVFRIGRK